MGLVGQVGRVGNKTLALPVVAAAVLLLGWSQLSRPGYSPDEEFTVFAVRGIEATHLPLLPSGLLYDRGLAYSYVAQVAHLLSGLELPAYRALALLFAIAALITIFEMVWRRTSRQAAIVALLLVATSPPFWSTATTGRFYAAFLCSYVLSLLLFSDSKTEGTVRVFGPQGIPLGPVTGRILDLYIGPVTMLCRLTHELAFTLVVIPFLSSILDVRGARARWIPVIVTVATCLVTVQGFIFILHSQAPTSGTTMIHRFFLWQVFNLFEIPPDRQFGIVLVVLVIAWLIAPHRARPSLVIALCGISFILSLSLTAEATVSPFTRVLVASVLREGSRYPLDMFWHIVRTNPVTITLALGLLVARLAGAGGEWRPIERAAHLLWIGWVVWFGVIDSGITVNYLLLPISFMLVAIAIDLAAILTHKVDVTTTAGRAVGVAASALVIAGVIADQWRGEGSIAERLAAARPTITVGGIDAIRDSLQPNDRVACTDELGCLMLVGRIDAWLALDDYVRERFIVKKGDGQLVGVYSGKPAVFRPADLFDLKPVERTIVVDVFKEYAVGNTRDWLPRALARDGLDVHVLLETPQVRVVEISPAVRHAAFRPFGAG